MKEQVLQLLLAGIMAGLFSLLTDRANLLTKRLPASEERRREWVLMGSCIPVILLCLLLRSAQAPLIPLHSGFIPLTVCLLYAKLSTALIVIAITALGSILLAYDTSWLMLLIDSGILLAPAGLWLSSYFKRGKQVSKLKKISVLVLAQFALHWLAVLVLRDTPDSIPLSEVMVYLGSALLSVLAVCIISLIIEGVLHNSELRSSLKQATARLHLESDKLKVYLEYMPLAAGILDQQGNIIHINTTMLEYYRRRIPDLHAEDIVGMHFSTWIDPDRFPELTASFERAMYGERDTKIVKSGTYVYLSSLSPIPEPGGDIAEALYVVQDMTELEMLRSEMGNVERLSLVGQMAAGITHEIRNPMAVVRGFLQLMREKSPVSLDHYYRIVMEELDRANGIINDFLSLAQNRIVEKEEKHLHGLVQELVPLLWADANLRGQTIELKLGDGVPNLYLNPKEIKQLILNLARNAMEAMGEKGLLTILTRTDEEFVELEVKDTGPGIPAERIGRLFEPFYTTKAKGTGLGLSLCMRIAERHHGTIAVNSAEGVGTSFIVRLRRLADYAPALSELKSSREA
ncbi:ATP-binding protein [Paenibacillus sp. P96]|uniref:histidine kinase n=1 Tax=Paenibacillus zeirhizosphaerae TaxID=2987519 RepID=A0ABT9FLK3_9BACL|nr:ATP-binding protein [Paenibacillus sp. P96]MDP4095612.1 ATP-binding protein [Paenibacillus sp. P96]